MAEGNLNDYLVQLEQVSAALACAPDNEELQQLATSLTELIELTQQQSEGQTQGEQTSSSGASNSCSSSQEDGANKTMDDEFALFKAEIAAVERGEDAGNVQSDSEENDTPASSSESNDQQPLEDHIADLKASLQGLVGTRCSAPFTQSWGQLEYHAAIVEGIDEASLEHATSPDHLKLRVLFSHPTQRVMQPCRYYLRHTCDYGDTCRFSHGHLVSVADIRQYSETVDDLSEGAPVLVQREGDSGLWQRAVLQSLDHETETASVRVSGHRQTRQVPLSETVPLPDSAAASGDVSSSASEEEDASRAGPSDPDRDQEEEDPETAEFCPRLTWTGITSTSQLGAWEKYTKGIGSRLMQQMGYVVGTGLGAQADGRVEPVEATVYPAGRSLDHCMALREGSAAGGGCLLTVEKRLEKEKKRQEKVGERAYRRSRTENAMFDVINRVMGGGGDAAAPERRPDKPKTVKTASRSELNVHDLRVGEQIREAERCVARLEAGCQRNQAGAVGTDLRAKLREQRALLDHLRATEASILREKRQRSDKRRMDVF